MQTQSFARGTALRTPVQAKVARPQRRSVVVRADGFIGSSTNQASGDAERWGLLRPSTVIMVLSTMLPIIAGRFGLAPTAKLRTTSSVKLYEDKSVSLGTNDPAGLTATDVLALGALGHAIGVGIVLGLKATNNI
ncbi:hypothetical protein N2152v2_010378 [Parachlorella kessleri]